VLGADDGGEANLVYTWSASGPGTVTYSANGTNAAKNSTPTFSAAGNYTFTATITDAGNLSTTSIVSVTVDQTITGIAGASPTMAVGMSQQLYLADQFGAPMAGSPPATWTASAGSITTGGLYTAPASPVTSVMITAQTASDTYTGYLAISDPFAWYKADESSGTTLADAAAGDQNAALTGSYNVASGISGNALQLTGGHALLPTGIVSGLGNFTIATWIKADSLDTAARIFDFGTGTDDYMYLTPKASGTDKLRFGITTSGSGGEQRINSSIGLNAGTWYHVAVVRSGSLGTLYVNGAAVGSNFITISPSSLGSTAQNYFGKSQFADPAFMGTIDDFRIFGRALSASEVLALAKPTVVTPAAPGASPVSGNSTTLSVLGTHQSAGESGLTYTWTTTGTPPAPVVFSANGTNAAKNTTATFTQPGDYSFQVTILNPTTGFSITSTTSVTVSLLPGDYNNDSVVDAGDYIVWRMNVGASTLTNRGTTIMGPVGQADYDFWRSQFGATASGSSAASSEDDTSTSAGVGLAVAVGSATMDAATAELQPDVDDATTVASPLTASLASADVRSSVAPEWATDRALETTLLLRKPLFDASTLVETEPYRNGERNSLELLLADRLERDSTEPSLAYPQEALDCEEDGSGDSLVGVRLGGLLENRRHEGVNEAW
jgi:hypothetical protein